MINIMEYFYSIQGEGSRVGHPSVFIRLSGCNFKCVGFGVKYKTPTGEEKYGCDSYYAVDTAFKNTWNKYTWDTLVTNIANIIPFTNKENKVDIVITGGEPLIWWDNNNFQSLLSYYITRGHKVTIETNSSININFTKDYQKDILFSMSTKLSNSGEKKQKRINIENITNIIENTKDSYLKFVIDKETSPHTIVEINDILEKIRCYVPIYLMPKGDTVETLTKNAKHVIELCIKNNFLYSDRIHIRIWDNTIGV